MKNLVRGFLPLAALTLLIVSATRGDDWPQWMGPQRDDVWRETGILDKFPPDGPPIKWRAPISGGYSGPVVAGGRVYVTDYVVEKGKITNNPAGRDKLEG